MREILGILPNYQYKAVMLLLTGRGPEKDWIGIPQMKGLNLYFSVPCSTLESSVCAHRKTENCTMNGLSITCLSLNFAR